MYKRTIASLLAALFMLPAMAGAQSTKADYRSAYQAAMAAHEKAVAHQSQWTATNEALASAEQAAHKGDYAEAADLARRARALARQAVKQAEQQDRLWEQAVIR
ncbi:MAG: hypothetical protein L0H83_03110 [Salinisphaera sp.]|nr:hypothetical protein [Salinisphaera sp.]